jgi:hypothetical protein
MSEPQRELKSNGSVCDRWSLLIKGSSGAAPVVTNARSERDRRSAAADPGQRIPYARRRPIKSP